MQKICRGLWRIGATYFILSVIGAVVYGIVSLIGTAGWWGGAPLTAAAILLLAYLIGSTD
jgi:hypothetical protein